MASEGKIKIVVVEDDPSQRKLIEVVLAAEEFVIYTAADGDEGLSLIRQVLPAMIVADVMMPSIDGFEMCRRLRTEPATANIPIIFVSARANLDDKLRAFDLGADDFIAKPYVPAELISRVKAIVRRMKPPTSEKLGPREEDRELRVAKILTDSSGILLAGQLSTASVIDVLQAIGWGTISGRLSVSAKSFGWIELRGGQLTHAQVNTERGNIYGIKAWLRLSSWTRGVFELRELGDAPPSVLSTHAINAPLQGMLLEAAYYRDEMEKLLAALPAPNMLLVRRGALPPAADPLDRAVWGTAGENGIELDRLYDQVDASDLEVLRSMIKLVQLGALAGKPLRRQAEQGR